MDFIDLIASAHPYLDLFDYDHYPDCFAEFEKNLTEWFDRREGAAEECTAENILDRFEQRWAQLPRRARKEAAFRDKQVLALFFSPAAERLSDDRKAFAADFREQWNARFPNNTLLSGRFEEILKGFDANLLGLPLRKSKQNRRQ